MVWLFRLLGVLVFLYLGVYSFVEELIPLGAPRIEMSTEEFNIYVRRFMYRGLVPFTGVTLSIICFGMASFLKRQKEHARYLRYLRAQLKAKSQNDQRPYEERFMPGGRNISQPYNPALFDRPNQARHDAQVNVREGRNVPLKDIPLPYQRRYRVLPGRGDNIPVPSKPAPTRPPVAPGSYDDRIIQPDQD